MTLKINVKVSTNKVGSEIEDTIDVHINGDETPKELELMKEEAAREWMYEQIEWGYTDFEEEN